LNQCLGCMLLKKGKANKPVGFKGPGIKI